MENSASKKEDSLLYRQLKLDDYNYFPSSNIREGFRSIFHFLYYIKNIDSVLDIDEVVLIDYIKYHKCKNFTDRSFQYVIKDIKNFLKFLEENHWYLKNIPRIDFSTENFHFWLRL